MNNNFSIKILGDVAFDGMVIIICYDNQNIAEINYEKGIDHMEIEIMHIKENLMFPLDDFMNAIEKAKKIAIKCAKEDELRK